MRKFNIYSAFLFTVIISVIGTMILFISHFGTVYKGGLFTNYNDLGRRQLPKNPTLANDFSVEFDEICRSQKFIENQETNLHVETDIILDGTKSLLYCRVAKVASTFWTRVLHILLNGWDFSDPFDIPRRRTYTDSFQKLLTKNISDIDDNFHNKYMSRIMIVRNPYDRLLSTYIDKFLSPNYIFWAAIGTYIIENYRFNATKKSRVCGHDVSFDEFAQFVSSGVSSNAHWDPIHKMCVPCKIHYNIIGKWETINKDIPDILSVIDPKKKIHRSDFKQQNANDLLQESMDRVHDIVRYQPNCSTTPEAIERICVVLQLKGLIHYKEKCQNIHTKGEIKNLLLKMESMSKKEISIVMIKRHITSVAYGSLSNETMERLKSYYYYDFKMFGYDIDFKLHESKYISWYPFPR